MASWQKRWEEDKATKKQRRSAWRGREQSREFSISACTQESKLNMHRRYRQEALSFYKEIWGIKHAEMNNLQMKKFLHKLKELA